MWQWAGDSSSLDDGFNPSAYRNHNHNLQHQVAILCDYVLELPLVPFKEAAENLDQGSHSGNIATLNALSKIPLATITDRTPITIGGVGTEPDLFVNRRETLGEVEAAGDWHVNVTTGVISVFTANDLGSITAADLTAVYYHYDTAVTAVSKFACASGPLVAGDFVVCDANSNFVKAAGGDDFKDIVGQVLEVESAAKDALDKVRTAYNPALGTDASGSLPGYAGQMDQMPGSATGGVSDKVHYAGAADLVVRINLVSR
jgi:hypothetical protein